MNLKRISALIVFAACLSVQLASQRSSSKWSFLVGGQLIYGLESTNSSPESALTTGYSPAFGAGVSVGLSYELTDRLGFCALVNLDAHHFGYTLLGAETLGLDNGRQVRGRYRTTFRGIGIPASLVAGPTFTLGNGVFQPQLIVQLGIRRWLLEHSNASAAYSAGYHLANNRQQARQQVFGSLGFGVSSRSSRHQTAILYTRSFDTTEPLLNSFMLRHLIRLSGNTGNVKCPTF